MKLTKRVGVTFCDHDLKCFYTKTTQLGPLKVKSGAVANCPRALRIAGPLELFSLSKPLVRDNKMAVFPLKNVAAFITNSKFWSRVSIEGGVYKRVAFNKNESFSNEK